MLALCRHSAARRSSLEDFGDREFVSVQWLVFGGRRLRDLSGSRATR